ncbi:MAG: hypothetical protein MK080_04385 [Opitutales bacterium]|nr:hypothetical protein [Opitutales bacterium]NRA26830.1 hypothetical protein [Opitutales bacterium]
MNDPKPGVFAVAADSVDVRAASRLGYRAPEYKSPWPRILLWVLIVCITGLFGIQVYFDNRSVDPYRESDMDSTLRAQSQCEALFRAFQRSVLASRVDVSEAKQMQRQAELYQQQGLWPDASQAFDQASMKVAGLLGASLQSEFDQLLPQDVQAILKRYAPAQFEHLQRMKAAAESDRLNAFFITYLNAATEVNRLARSIRFQWQAQLTELAAEAMQHGRVKAAATFYTDLMVLEPSNKDGANFFRHTYYRPGDFYVSGSGITFICVPGFAVDLPNRFVSTSEVDPAILALALDESADNIAEKGLSHDQMQRALDRLSAFDGKIYSVLSADEFEALTEPILSDDQSIAFNIHGIYHRDVTRPEWVIEMDVEVLAAYDLARDGDESRIPEVVYPTPTSEATGDLRISFVPDRSLALVSSGSP